MVSFAKLGAWVFAQMENRANNHRIFWPRSKHMAVPGSEDPYGDAAPLLPANLGAAIAAFSASSMYRDTLGDEAVDYLCRLKRAEWERYLSAISEWEQAEYFGLF